MHILTLLKSDELNWMMSLKLGLMTQHLQTVSMKLFDRPRPTSNNPLMKK